MLLDEMTFPYGEIMKPSRRSRAMKSFMGALMVLIATNVAGAVEIQVTMKGDVFALDGKCSLREALQAAELNQRVNECRAGAPTGQDIIRLGAGTYRLSSRLAVAN
jgi:hypothetical protein